MSNTFAQLISAGLATLRSGGWVRVVGAKGLNFEFKATDQHAKVRLMSNRFAHTLDLADETKSPFEPIVSGTLDDVRLSSDLAKGVLALLKMAHVTPCCELRLGTDDSAINSMPAACLLSLNDTIYPLVFNHCVTMPTTWSDETKLHLFSEEQDAKREHLAVICDSVKTDEAPLVRVHSKCATGDIFNSLRCDCGEQLSSAKEIIGASGNGILIYLDQEGRGIGLRNKLAAYTLQDTGTDTFEANHQLGYESDERTYEAAVTILKHLGVSKIRLLTNNPDKIDQLGSSIEVVARVPIIAEEEPNRQSYIDAKKQSGHLF
ncbi:MAG: GTP cyclohydrolase II [Alphaproteobacteria bacterium]